MGKKRDNSKDTRSESAKVEDDDRHLDNAGKASDDDRQGLWDAINDGRK
jgi:hypothetical protein